MTQKGPRSPSEAEPAGKVDEIVARWGLTSRQGEVLAFLVKGARNKAIAAELGCAEVTVEFHVTAILRGAGVDSRSAAVAKFWAEAGNRASG